MAKRSAYGKPNMAAIIFLACLLVLAAIAAVGVAITSSKEAAAASLGVGVTIPPHTINQTAPIQNKTASVNGTNVSIGLPVTYNGTGLQNLTLSLPTGWKKVTNIRINESGVIKNVTIDGNEITFEANLSAPNVTMLFDAAPPALTKAAELANSTFFQKNLTIESDNAFTNASASIEVNSSFPFYTLYWFNGSDYVDKTVAFNLKAVNGTATFDSFSTSTVLFSLEGALACTESWSCGSWSDSRQCGTRTCTDSNHCGTTNSKPSESLACPEAAAPAAGGGSSGSGGGGGFVGAPIVAKPKQTLTADNKKIKVALKPGESKKRSFSITNIGSEKLRLNVEAEGLADFASVDTSYMVLEPGSSRTIGILFFAAEEVEPGAHSGRVRIIGDGAELLIDVLVEVTSTKSLFDVIVTVNPKTKSVLAGDSVIGDVTIFNLGGTGRFDALVVYGVKDYNDRLIVSKQQTVAVETRASIINVLELPRDLPPGQYYVFADVILGTEKAGVGSDTFEVLTPLVLGASSPLGTNILFMILVSLLMIIGLLSVISIAEIVKHHLPQPAYHAAVPIRQAQRSGSRFGGWAATLKAGFGKPRETQVAAATGPSRNSARRNAQSAAADLRRKPTLELAPKPASQEELENNLKSLDEKFSEGTVSVRSYIEEKVQLQKELKRLNSGNNGGNN